MADERIAKTVLRYEVDQASVNKAAASVNRVRKDLKDLDASSKLSLNRVESLTQSASRALSGLGLSGLGDVGGQAADVLQLRNTLKDALTSITAVEGGVAAAGASFAAALGPIVAVGAPLLLLKGIMDNLQTSADNAAKAEQAYFDMQVKNLERQAQLRKDAAEKTAEQNRKDFLETEQQLKDLSDLMEKKRAERRKVNQDFEALGASLNPGERSRLGTLGQELDKEIQQLAERYRDLSKKLGDQVVVLDPLIKKREEEEKATKKLVEQHDALAEAMRRELELAEQYDQDLIDRRNANLKKSLDAEKQAAKDRAAAEDRIIDATRRANTDIENIEQRALERRAAIQDQLNKKIVDITRQAAEAAENALTNLKQQREDLTTGLGRDLAAADREAQAKQLDVRIEAQREEARSLREHERNKARILEDSRDREFELILNRDFLGLFNLRRQTTGSLQRADSDFSATQQERRIGAGEQLDDLRRQLASERQERLIAYQQQLADAQLAYNREITMVAAQREQALMIARMGRNAELQELQTSTRNALLARRNQAAEEIRVAGLVGQARINYLNQERQMLLNQASAFRGNTSIGGTRAVAALRDSGGPLRAGQMAAIGVGGEAFNGYALPSPGLFMPTVGGNVTKHTTVQNSWSITGNNPDQIGRVVRGQVEGLLKAYLT